MNQVKADLFSKQGKAKLPTEILERMRLHRLKKVNGKMGYLGIGFTIHLTRGRGIAKDDLSTVAQPIPYPLCIAQGHSKQVYGDMVNTRIC